MGSSAQRAAIAAAPEKPETNGVCALRRNERIVLRALEAAGSPRTAYQLLESLQDEGLRAPMTIYRSLAVLMKLGRVRKIISLNAFVPAKAGARATGFIICKECGVVRECALPLGNAEDLFAGAGMSIEEVVIEARGVCEDRNCRRGSH